MADGLSSLLHRLRKRTSRSRGKKNPERRIVFESLEARALLAHIFSVSAYDSQAEEPTSLNPSVIDKGIFKITLTNPDGNATCANFSDVELGSFPASYQAPPDYEYQGNFGDCTHGIKIGGLYTNEVYLTIVPLDAVTKV